MSLSDISGSGSELSSRHIPDMDALSNISNTSFSFQIPGTTTGDNLLADEVESDFFRNAGGADVSLAVTHASAFFPAATSPACIVERKEVEGPMLPLNEAESSTPERIADPPTYSLGLAVDNSKHKSSIQRPKLSLNIGPIIRAVHTSPMTPMPLPTHELPRSTVDDQGECNHPLLESKIPMVQNSVQLPDGPEITRRPTRKKVEITEEQQSRKKGLLRNQRKIVEGGIAKSRVATSKKPREVPSRPVPSSTLPLGSTQRSAPSLPKHPALTEDPGAEALLADSSTSSIFPMTGIAGRLIHYGQKYVDTFCDQRDTNVSTEKLRAELDFPSQTNQAPLVVQKTTQDQERGEEAPNDSPILPKEQIADSLIRYRKKDPETDFAHNGLTEKVSFDFGLQSAAINQATSVVQTTTEERNEEDLGEDEIEDDRSKPLTFLQLSPRKQRTQERVKPPTPIITSGTVTAPTRPASKRPMATESTFEEHRLKRSKGDEHKTKERPTKPTGKLNSKPRVPSARSQPQSRKPSATLSGSGSSSSSKKSDSSLMAAAPKPAGIRRTKSRIVPSGKQAAVFNPGSGWNDDVHLSGEKDMQRSGSSLKLSGSSLQNSRVQNERKQDQNAPLPSSSFKGEGVPQPTEPTPEDSESRPTSRSHSNSQSHKHKFYHPAPNFKAIHAAFDASLSHRKENVHPTIPLPMRWETESRVQERKKFEDRVREKEREREKEEEERKRLRETEQERELKELRKKMVVKAHEVPEWYNARPKTKKRQEQDVEN